MKETGGFNTRKKKIMSDRQYDFIMMFVCRSRLRFFIH